MAYPNPESSEVSGGDKITADQYNNLRGDALSMFFGGDGSDGALSISSGTTTIDCENEAVVVKNYTSVSITGTGKLDFINPHANGTIVILRSQGDVTLTSSEAPMIDLSGMGSSVGNNGSWILDDDDHFGKNGGVASGGAGGAILTLREFYLTEIDRLARKAIYLAAGSAGGDGHNGGGSNFGHGGGGGGSHAGVGGTGASGSSGGTCAGGGGIRGQGVGLGTAGDGGRGGGGLLIECGGSLNFTTANGISTAGEDGTDAVRESKAAGGGGGGAGGMAVVLYNDLIDDSGTIDNSGGRGGKNSDGDAGGSGGSGDGGLIGKNTHIY